MKRINTRAKGAKNELRAKKLLESEGYLVYRVKGSTKWNKDVDIFGLFDLFGINKKGYIKLVQVKTNRKPNMRPFFEFESTYGNYWITVEVWVWYDRKGFKRYVQR